MTIAFISYSRHDSDFLHRLVKDLEAVGVSVFFDQRVQPEASWVTSISEAIERARFLLVVLSPDYVESQRAQEKMKIGLLRKSEGKAPVVPLMVRKCQPPSYIAGKAYANYANSYDVGLSQFVAVLTEAVPNYLAEAARGDLASQADPNQVSQFPTELKEAVALFKSAPQPFARASNTLLSLGAHKSCRIVMPFGIPDLQIVYGYIVWPVIEQCGLACKRTSTCSVLT